MSSPVTARLARNGLWAHKRRLAGTFAAIFLGVAFLAGTLMLGDTLQRNFERLFGEVTSGTDAVVRGAGSAGGELDERAPIPASLLSSVRAVDGVGRAELSIQGRGMLIGSDGERIGGNGPPTLAGNWISDSELNPYRIASGRPPRADDEVVINRGAAEAGGLSVGDRTVVQTPEPVRVRIAGIATFGDADGLGTTTFTAFTTAGAARHVLKRAGEASSIVVAGAPGVSQTALVQRLRAAVGGPGVSVATGAQLTADRVRDVDETFLNGLRTVLVAFAAIALLVAAFSIHDTFSIVAAQRTRESALLRAVGATRGQVLGATLLETAAVGVVASLAGLAGGVLIASALKGLFDALGFALPAGGLAVTATSALVAVGVGVVVTVLAGIAPARAAGRVPPIAALREAVPGGGRAAGAATGANPPSRRNVPYRDTNPPRWISPDHVRTTAARWISRGGRGGGGGRRGGGGLRGGGGRLVAAAAGVIGAPLARLRPPVGGMARRNAMRDPRRTLGAASALLVGVTVVTAFTVVGASLKATLDAGAERGVRSDLVIDGGEFDEGSLPPALAREVAALPGVRAAVGLGAGEARIGGRGEQVRIADPAALAGLVDLGIEGDASGSGGAAGSGAASGSGGAAGGSGAAAGASGSGGAAGGSGAASGGGAAAGGAAGAGASGPSATSSLAPLPSRSIAVSRDAADEHGWGVGSEIEMAFPDGARERLTVATVYAETGIAGDYLVPRAAWAGHARQDADATVFIDAATPAAAKRVAQAASRWGAPAPQTRMEFVEAAGAQVDMVLAIVYAMLVLAVLIALLGIANALSLATHERTRELGLLRAVGQTRGQVRAMVRYEAVVVALLGTTGGLLLGVPLAWVLVQLAGEIGIDRFALPLGQLAVVLVVGALAGVLAGVRPARRAARLDVLRAIATQ